jgi:hypothetical protein
VDAEKWRSERVRGRAVLYALGGLLGAKSYDGEVCCDGCSVSGARSASHIRCRSRSLFLSFPSPSKRMALRRPEAGEVKVEFDVLMV